MRSASIHQRKVPARWPVGETNAGALEPGVMSNLDIQGRPNARQPLPLPIAAIIVAKAALLVGAIKKCHSAIAFCSALHA